MTSPSPRWERVLIIIIATLNFLLALGFSTGPIFEGFSEHEHYRMVHTMVQERGLSDASVRRDTQYHQPPLYYVLAVPAQLISGPDDFAEIEARWNDYRWVPSFSLNVNDNKNYFIHSSAEQFPYQSGTARAIHLMRLLSVFSGVGTVLASYALYSILWPEHPTRRLLATAFVAFWPQFLYISGLLNNDTLLYFLGTLALYLIVKQIRDGVTLKSAVILGVVLGAGLLTKTNMLLFAVPTGIAYVLDRKAWRYIPVTLGIVLALALWWYIRNLVLYDDLTGFPYMLKLSGWWKPPEARPSLLEVLPKYPVTIKTMWVVFGNIAVWLPESVYIFFYGCLGLGVVGAIAKVAAMLAGRISRPDNKQLIQALVIASYGVLLVAAMVSLSRIFKYGHEGRYLLPGIVVWSALIVYGLSAIIPEKLSRWITPVIGFALVGIASVSLFMYYLPSYSVRPASPAIEQPLDITYEDTARLIGVETSLIHARPGELVPVTLYWEALRPSEGRLLTYLHTENSDLIRRNTYPATGGLISTEWTTGQTWTENYVLSIPDDAQPQTVYTLIAGLTEEEDGRILDANIADIGQDIPRIGRLAVHAEPSEAVDAIYQLGEGIGLVEAVVENNVEETEVCVTWVSQAEQVQDYNFFVHIVIAGEVVAQHDGQPVQGAFPTSVWLPGEVINDCVTLSTPELDNTDWWINLGMYTVPDIVRLPVIDSAGQPQPDNVIVLTPDS